MLTPCTVDMWAFFIMLNIFKCKSKKYITISVGLAYKTAEQIMFYEDRGYKLMHIHSQHQETYLTFKK